MTTGRINQVCLKPLRRERSREVHSFARLSSKCAIVQVSRQQCWIATESAAMTANTASAERTYHLTPETKQRSSPEAVPNQCQVLLAFTRRSAQYQMYQFSTSVNIHKGTQTRYSKEYNHCTRFFPWSVSLVTKVKQPQSERKDNESNGREPER